MTRNKMGTTKRNAITFTLFLMLFLFSYSINAEILDSKNPETTSIISTLKSNLVTSSIITINNPDTELSIDALKISFNEVCGHVRSYSILVPKNCTRSTPIYKYTNQSNANSTISVIATLDHYENTTYLCYETAKNIPSGIQDYKIQADILAEKCYDNTIGWKIDWKPELTIKDITYIRDDWAWYNGTGGTITYDGLYTIVTYTSNGTFKVEGTIPNAEVLIVGGGGSGANNGSTGYGGSGGGAGGLLVGNLTNILPANYTIIVGSGGNNTGVNSKAQNGQPSSFYNCTAYGGGGGGAYQNNGQAGGSGGGASWNNMQGASPNQTNCSTLLGYGGKGGNTKNSDSYGAAGAGGGAGGDVANITDNYPKTGGLGLNFSISGTNLNYSCGGGATTGGTGYYNSSGGCSRAGSGAALTSGFNATANSGCGGGGTTTGTTAGAGGSGIVIIRYLTSTESPSPITFNSQVPSDITTTNLFYQVVNISYNYSDATSNASKILYYKTNNSVNDWWRKFNGSISETGWLTKNYSSISGAIANFILDDNIYPVIANIDPEYISSVNHSYQTLSNTNQFALTHFYGIFTNKSYSFIEFMANSTQNFDTYICNNSYTTGAIATSQYCRPLVTIQGNRSVNHSHTGNYAQHFVISLPFNQSAYKNMTFNDYDLILAIRGNTANVRVYYVTNVTRPSTSQVTANNGVAWANQAYTIDAHLHQYNTSTNESLWYYGCGNETNQTCLNGNETKQDLLDFAGLPPSPPTIINPYNNTYNYTNTTLYIDYFESISPNAYPILYYWINLLNVNQSFYSNITNNSLNLNYAWNYSLIPNGYYYINVTSIDNQSQRGYDLSEEFLLLSCIENWTNISYNCWINDSYELLWNDSNNCNTTFTLPEGNGTSIECDYCDPILVNSTSNCSRDGTQQINWTDLAYYQCCIYTMLPEDCPLIEGFNSTTINCTNNDTNPQCEENLTTEFTCQYDPIPIIQSKMNIVCQLPATNNWSCVVNVLQNDTLLATTPEYRESNRFLSFGEESEIRTSFETTNAILNGYYVGKNLRTDTPFTLEVICSARNETLTSQYCITPTYIKPDWTLNIMTWAKANVLTLMALIFFIIIIAGIVIYYIKRL